MNPYLPHTRDEIAQMLSVIGADSMENLFDDIPEEIRLRSPLDLPAGLSEWEVERELDRLASRNETHLISFLGGGSYDHLVPAAVRHVMSRPEFATAYTPYQPEISQGLLQAIFEFQTMMCMLTGLDVSNASLYDGATAAVEACAMALASKRQSDTILYSQTLHPHTIEVLKTAFAGTTAKLVPVAAENGVTSSNELKKLLTPSTAALLVQSPNAFGYVEDFRGIEEHVHGINALFVISANPLSLALLKSPGEWGADIAVGDTQVLGIPQSFGGPSAGFITAREALLRKMPGRIVGQSVDNKGRRAFVLTLQAREQHIKRERATSNICTNEALVALGNAAYLAELGEQGFAELCRRNAENAQYLFDSLTGRLGLATLHEQPFFNEFTIRLPLPAREVVAQMHSRGFLAGLSPDMLGPGWEQRGVPAEALTIAVTEKRTKQEMDAYVDALRGVLHHGR